MKKRENKKGTAIADYLPFLILSIIILAVILVSVFLMKGEGFKFIDQIQNFFRGR